MADCCEQMILVVNPGGTSTKVAVYGDDRELFDEDVRHPRGELDKFESVLAQLDWRLHKIQSIVEERGFDLNAMSAVVGRGGPLAPCPGGTFIVDELMIEATRQGRVMVEHASLLGAPLAFELAKNSGCPSYIVDPVTVDELLPEAKITGLPRVPKRALSHALSVKSASREASLQLEGSLEELNFVVLHLGSGITVAALRQGKIIDATDPTAAGPMSPTRTGGLPALGLCRLCFGGEYTLSEMEKLIVGQGGWMAHLGTDDIREIYKRIEQGSSRARLVLDATLHQLAKETGSMAAVLRGKVDGIVITGGVARSRPFVEELEKRVAWICDEFIVLPGGNEMKALASGALRALRGECEALSMGPYIAKFEKEKL
jgi:butyrate kinase